MIFIAFFIGISLLCSSNLVDCFHNYVGCHSKFTALKLKDDRRPEKRQRIVNIDNIGSLFGPSGIKFERAGTEDDAEEEELETADIEIGIEDDDLDETSDDSMNVKKNLNAEVPAQQVVNSRGGEEISSLKYDEFGYVALDGTLDKKTQLSILDSMSLSFDGDLTAPRVFQYDPKEWSKPDPMVYGAYRRWKLAEGEVKAGKDKKKKRGNQNSSDPKKKKGSTTNGFYDAIKNLGSGPVPKGTASTTGVIEPPPNKKPIQMQKGLPKKNKKKIITPDEINSLFKKDGASSASNTAKISTKDSRDDDDDDDAYDDDDEDDVNDDNINDKNRKTGSSQAQPFFNPMSDANEPIPQWLVDAEKEAQQKRKNLKKRRRKKITDDWRFWAALVAGAGFASAFYSIYMQTGGFDGAGMGGSIFGGGGGSDELII